MLLKCMSKEDAPDDDSRKTHRVLSGVKSVEFVRGQNGPVAVVEFEGGGWHEENLYGNAYLMNDAGKTVSSFGFANLPPHDPFSESPINQR